MPIDQNGTFIPTVRVPAAMKSKLKGYAMAGNAKQADADNPKNVLFSLASSLASGSVFVVIVNSMPEPLCLTDEYIDHGSQAGVPLVGVPGFPSAEGDFKIHQIPGIRQDPHAAGQHLYGVGVYQIDSNWLGNAGGVLQFSYTKGGGGPFLAVAFLQHQSTFHGPCAAVTADLGTEYKGDQVAFYNATANQYQGNKSSKNADVAIWGSFFNDIYNTTLTIYVGPADEQ